MPSPDPKTARRIPLNFFGMPFGLAGLAETWVTLARYGQLPAGFGDGLLALAALVWLIVLGCYLRYAFSRRGAIVADLLDPVAAPFASLALLTPMLLAAQGVYPHAAIAGTVLLDVFLVSTVLLGGWFTGQWIYRPLELDRMHPGYFLPTVAGGLVAAGGAAEVGQRRLAEVVFGLGLICWIVLGSILLARLLVRPALPAALTPTLAIEVAPAAVASLAYFGLNGDRVDFAAAVLAGYGMLMVLAQLRLIPAYRRLSFMPGLWAFTFPWAAVATSAIHWLHDTAPTGSRGYEYVILAAITTGIGSLAIRTLAALAQGKLLAAPSATPTGSPAEPSGPKPPSLASADRRGTG